MNRPGDRRRAALRIEMHDLPLDLPSSRDGRNLKLDKFFQAAKQLNAKFERNYNKKTNVQNLDKTYMLGKRLMQFIVEEIPRHPDYRAPKYNKQREKLSKYVEGCFGKLSHLSDQMDAEEYEKIKTQKSSRALNQAEMKINAVKAHQQQYPHQHQHQHQQTSDESSGGAGGSDRGVDVRRISHSNSNHNRPSRPTSMEDLRDAGGRTRLSVSNHNNYEQDISNRSRQMLTKDQRLSQSHHHEKRNMIKNQRKNSGGKSERRPKSRVPFLDKLAASTSDHSQQEPPEGNVTIVFTDVQGSTALWEANPNAMEDALRTHDEIMRKCCAEANGYEITTEGDAFQLAFHNPVDASAFCLQVQMDLYRAAWSDTILRNSHAKIDKLGKFRGLCVRMGMHHGPVSSKLHEITGHTRYSGPTVMVAKGTEGLCHGGQILMTIDAYRQISGRLRDLGDPQVLDLGEHLLYTDKSRDPLDNSNDGVDVCKFVVQLVPKAFSYDYYKNRRSEGGYGSMPATGRLFEPPITKKQITSSFLDAPYKNGLATIAFVYTVGLKELHEDLADETFTVLWKLLRSKLEIGDGYECQEDRGAWMLAFGSRENAVRFGLTLMEAIQRTAAFHPNVNRRALIKVGIHTGHFTSMGPHAITGRADYFGTVVNRAARVAGFAQPGQVVCGIMGASDSAPFMGNNVQAGFLGTQELKGVSGEMGIFSCEWNK
eukprot:CAMPEP_0195286954 /NCGR_PEP_ID=MMETSP0707-20130614/4211_1 /TAXON_ID=33640 /ORGANISM="Asterionellopsis glacialis, Strain CCMP134" /LENGTH=709 /DNA_ID=CAMNT_0040346657 /DNA_START=93 /DNA_END=2222 /DNA_ORIENTATION=+